MQGQAMSGRGRGAALLERTDEENPAQTKTKDNLEYDKCSHNKQEVRRARPRRVGSVSARVRAPQLEP